MHWFALRVLGHTGLHQFPHFVGNRDRVAVQIHAEAGDDIGFGADTHCGAERLAREHVRTVEFTGDHAIEDDLPVGLWLERDIQAFILEEALFVRDGERRHVGELDEAELELFLLGPLAGCRGVHRERQRGDNGCNDSPEHYMRHY